MFAGVGVLCVILPLNAFIMAKSQTYETKEMEHKDDRIKQLTEVLNGMKILKLYAWELPFQKKINDIRNTELSYTQKNFYIWGTIVVLWTWAPTAVMLVAFITYIYSGADHVLTAQRAFVSLSLFNILRLPLTILPWGITSSVNVSS